MLLVIVFFHVSFAVNPKNGRPGSMISKEIYEIVLRLWTLLSSTIVISTTTCESIAFSPDM